jgi:hypothetical protein
MRLRRRLLGQSSRRMAMKLHLKSPALLLALLLPLSVHPASTADPSDVALVIKKFKEKDRGMAKVFADAHGYAVFPTVGKGGIGVGAARGYSEVVFFKDAAALTARASADLAYRTGVAIVTMAKGGLMYEASVGGQKFSYKPIGKKT